MPTKTKKSKRKLIPCIICGGSIGRAVIYGRVEKLPKAEEIVTIYDARMILKWTGDNGLLGLAAMGPSDGSRITCAIDSVSDTARQVLAVSDVAAKKLDRWPNA